MIDSADNQVSLPKEESRTLQFTVEPHENKLRLDHFLVRHRPDLSRSYVTKLIQKRLVVVDGQAVKAGYKIRVNENINVTLPEPEPSTLQPQRVDFETLFEDEHLLVISKPPGIVVHPAAGHREGTLVQGLLHRYHELPSLEGGRPGIVHRLDKDTSGIMLVAKTENCLRALADSFKAREIHKRYKAVLLRSPLRDRGRITAPIGRHRVNRKKMAVREIGGRSAVSNWKVLERFENGWCLVDVIIETGRTHQIRVHMASMNTPVAGDELYGGKVKKEALVQPERQLLHAYSIDFDHPVNGKRVHFTAPIWPDMESCLSLLRGEAK